MSVTGSTEMVSAKKARRTRRARYYRRRYRRLRRRYRRYRRTRRFPKNTEVKSVNKHFSGSVMTAASTGSTPLINFQPGFAISIGGDSDELIPNNISIAQGTGLSQRVGAKVEPIKLRISGSFSLEFKENQQMTYAPNFWQVRVIVYQVKGGNATHAPNEGGYHQMAIITEDGSATAGDFKRVLAYYRSQTETVFSQADWNANNGLAYTPLRRGLGHLCHILYKKSFWINTQKNPIKQFRFLTRKPKRLVYPETANGNMANDVQANANNCIYVLFMFQPGSFDSRAVPILNFNVVCDMFYTDK